MQHYTMDDKSTGNEEDLKLENEKEDVFGAKVERIITKKMKSISCGFAVAGILMFIIGLIIILNDTYQYTPASRCLSFSIMFLSGPPIFLIGTYLYKSTISLAFKAVYFVGLLIMLFFFANGFLMMIFAEQLVCRPFFYAYDPEIGFCDCDDRPLLETNTAPVFLPRDEFNSTFFRIASIGDIEIDSDGRKNLENVASKNPDFLVVNGDITYLADPEGFDAILTDIFGPNFPVMVTVGNHDTGIWTDYQKVVQDRYNRYLASVEGDEEVTQLRCEGTIGVDGFCSFNNFGLIFSGLGSTCGDDDDLNVNLKAQLQVMEDNDVVWRTVFVHKNQRLLQTGSKIDEVGNQAYENSLSFGAVVMNSHEHTYARTKQLSGVGSSASDFSFVSEEDQENIDGVELINVGADSFAVVANGLGGKSIRSPKSGLESNPWWGKTFNDRSSGINYGAHFCEYGVNGEANLARCFFETVDGFVVDEYFVRSNN